MIGGAEDPDEEKMKILPHLVKLAGGERARVLICSAPSAEPEEKVRVYGRLFRKIGAAEVLDAPLKDRAQAEEDQMVEAAERATAIFFSGGDQLRMTAIMAGTRFSEVVRRRLAEDGLLVAGTSAGAAAASSTMIIAGPSGGTVRRADVTLAPGLGYWRDSVVDTHFNQRGRVHRLLTIFAQNPQILGIGIDENTALELEPGRRFSVVGAGVVMVFDGRVSHSNAPERGADEPISVTDSVIHVLAEGYGFDVAEKRPILPGGKLVKPAQSMSGSED